MKVGRNSVINSNISNFCSPGRYPKAHITRINPDKNTFLNSNLLVSNILNHLSPSHENRSSFDCPDAYENREVQMRRNFEDQRQTKDKINRVRNLAKCRSQTTLEQKEQQQREIQKQVEQISVMKIEMVEKARDIMSRKEDTAYLGRNIFLQGEKFLKQMKDYNPVEKVSKIEATRMLMKERAKSKGRNNIQVERQIADQTSDFISHGSGGVNNSMNTSTLEGSMETNQRKHQRQMRNKQSERQMASMIKNKSFESVMGEQRRLAVWRGFVQNWAQGFTKNEDLITTKKKRKAKKSPKQKYIQSGDHSQLDYHDKLSRHLALKKYKETFNQTAATFQILSQ